MSRKTSHILGALGSPIHPSLLLTHSFIHSFIRSFVWGVCMHACVHVRVTACMWQPEDSP